MSDSATSIFEQHAAGYEALRRRLVPPYDEFYGAAVGALALADGPLRRVLDLGAGTGLLARAVGRAYPGAELTLLDGSPAMLAHAREALGEEARYVSGDLASALPGGPWDAVVSALAIHHLEDAQKRELFARVHDALSPGGVFVNAEQVRSPSASLERAVADWHEQQARRLGASDAEWADARERMCADRLATNGDQLEWLSAAGFTDVDCPFKDHCFAVLVARRGAA
jgi:tRNA (cmo5U34)-methyltransferase